MAPLPLRPFEIADPRLPKGPPSEEHPITNPMTMLLCRYPLGQYLSNPNFTLIYSSYNPFDEYQDPLYAMLTAGSQAPLEPSQDAEKKTFWMKTYSENTGLLEKLEEQGILRRTRQVEKQGFVELVAVETVLKRGEWAETCSNQECGRRELVGDEEKRMVRCLKCKESYYCGKECQTRELSSDTILLVKF